ncbi:glycoside hydrolase family 43 protein [Kushneria phosphatilytica]|uniref:Glycoside hydrolase family 43 protein n=1 Tax=Kushneria phosphatilytica TaxID=657387 RepID=A0A1S1NT75_9GAMM|nr:glycoside hydrolase family 43 protein [Kushneria phosphatilytica]OHV07545.1 glycoside hydrolase 43 family protein [Kushneria phosphatilytica]QEL10031.1 glycoside hydrolase family 43 protein [Kushneria phosphatilytica]
MTVITNPVLPGYHPDPSILRVGDDYYIAVSTFEWFPGVQIHHSRDLVHWRLLTHPLTRVSQLDMVGNIDSGGVWAPCLSYADGRFYLIYTDVKSRQGAFKDTHNYLVTAEHIEGPWSDPVYLNSSGFDPSLFHDEDGSKWLLNMIWDFRKGQNSFAGIALQRYDPDRQCLTGPVHNIFRGTRLGVTEAPHLYQRDGYYYLVTAEGGTGYNHAVTVARSMSLFGPYEVDPDNPILTSDQTDQSCLQKAGHASLVETQQGDWYMAHLCARPVVDGKCILGRETALQKCYWNEAGWLRVEGGPAPAWSVAAPNLPSYSFPPEPLRDDFSSTGLQPYWNSLRRPFTQDWLSLSERPGFLRLKGGESMQSTHRQSLLARRLEGFHVDVATELDFSPEHFQQMAGLIVYYDTADYVYLRVTHHETLGKCLGIIESRHGRYDEPLTREVALPATPTCLKASIDRERLQFYFAVENGAWQAIGSEHDIRHLSDDDADYIRFTGTFVGVCVQDLGGQGRWADFAWFDYRPREAVQDS